MKWEINKNSARIPMSETRVRNGLVPAAYLALFKKDHILLLRRFQTGYEDGNYSLIAGHVEEGETYTDCVVREAKEEAGIIVRPENLFAAHVMQRNIGKGRIEIFFVATQWTGKIVNKEPHKCDDLSWHQCENLPKNTIDYIKQAIAKITQENFYSEYGW